MISGHCMMAMSLDGFVARSDHALDWLHKQDVQTEDHGFEPFMQSVDVIVMGSGSLRTVLGFDTWVYQKPVVVMSRSLQASEIPDALQDRIRISRLKPAVLMQELAESGHERVYVDGGALIQSFLREGLIVDMKITIVPILIGQGIRLFGEIDRDIDMKLESCQHFPSGLVDLQYTLVN